MKFHMIGGAGGGGGSKFKAIPDILGGNGTIFLA